MNSPDEFLPAVGHPHDPLAHLNSHTTSLDDIGRIEVHDPTTSLGGDGRPDTETFHEGDELIVASDLGHDGVADHLKIIDPDGDYSSWEYRHDEGGDHWVETDHGHLG